MAPDPRPERGVEAYIAILQRWNAPEEHCSALKEDANPDAYGEDLYREIGRFYYRGAWCATSYPGASRLESWMRGIIDNALHGNRTDSWLHSAWPKLEGTLKSALNYLEDKALSKGQRVELAKNACFMAIFMLLSIERALERLNECVKAADRIDMQYYGQRISIVELRRTEALWQWLCGLPETHVALRAGRTKEDLLEEVRGGYVDGYYV